MAQRDPAGRQGRSARARTTHLQDLGEKTIKMLDTPNTQFDSFLFWRQPIPELDLSELEGLGLVDGPSIKGGQGEKKPKGSQKAQDWEGSDEEAELSEYNSFNYWREPIASIDLLDFNLLL
ncbi:hypothetical protein AGOR_G00043540 [Albula goreensis]|uniref:Protein AF1q n=1 Tax=Albula goreensis TaxID=1534307 RepID=A0A8T3DYC1_9TELE|nr:hypothetical protein AGOR_G00043540 [Albula goreensis]